MTSKLLNLRSSRCECFLAGLRRWCWVKRLRSMLACRTAARNAPPVLRPKCFTVATSFGSTQRTPRPNARGGSGQECKRLARVIIQHTGDPELHPPDQAQPTRR